jgi:hypothetical protein
MLRVAARTKSDRLRVEAMNAKRYATIPELPRLRPNLTARIT